MARLKVYETFQLLFNAVLTYGQTCRFWSSFKDAAVGEKNYMFNESRSRMEMAKWNWFRKYFQNF